MPATELIYVADPMCSWCYGFGPQVEEVRAASDVSIRLLMGGLFVGDYVQPASPQLREYFEQTWSHVETRTGQSFRFDRVDPLVREPWVYDTAPSCQAVIHVRDEEPEQALTYFHAVQRAFYVDGRDVTKWDVLDEIAQEIGLSSIATIDSLLKPSSLEQDIIEARALGARGFPRLLIARQTDRGTTEYVALATGHTRASEILQKLSVFRA